MLRSVQMTMLITWCALLQLLLKSTFLLTSFIDGLGHRSIQALGVASRSNLWDDASLVPNEDSFCWGCEITFSKKASCGKSDLTADTSLQSGSCLMLDLQQNTSRHGLNRATHFPYFLQITDAYTHFTMLLGLSEVTASAIFDFLLHYAIH